MMMGPPLAKDDHCRDDTGTQKIEAAQRNAETESYFEYFSF